MTSANNRQIGGDHYGTSELQHWDMIEMYGVGYLEGCATKYISRWRQKGGLADLEKSEHYLQKLIECVEGWGRRARGYVPMSELYRFFELNNIDNTTERSLIIQFCRWQEPQHLYALRDDLRQYIEIERNFDYATS